MGTDVEHTFEAMREYMFTPRVIEKLVSNVESDAAFIAERKAKKKLKREGKAIVASSIQKASSEKHAVEVFKPRGRDSLFWCFYVASEGLGQYNVNSHHLFQLEKEYKIESVSQLRKISAALKAAKISLNRAEDELVNKPEIGATALRALLLLKQMNIVYKIGDTFYDFSNGGTRTYLVELVDKHNRITLSDSSNVIDEIRARCFRIDPVKPLRGISTFTNGALHDICIRLSINITNDSGKSKIKRVLYDEIVVKLGKLQEPV